MRNTLCFILILVLMGCQATPQADPWQTIDGRDEGNAGIVRYPVYRARVPQHWQRIDPPVSASNADSTLPICTFELPDLRIVIHNFPVNSIEQRIPPGAQVARWQQQTGKPAAVIEPVAHGGFAGFLFEAEGGGVVGWAMQLAPEHFHALANLSATPAERTFFRQMQADYTIKVTGSPDAIAAARPEIDQFARSFELIQAIPGR